MNVLFESLEIIFDIMFKHDVAIFVKNKEVVLFGVLIDATVIVGDNLADSNDRSSFIIGKNI